MPPAICYLPRLYGDPADNARPVAVAVAVYPGHVSCSFQLKPHTHHLIYTTLVLLCISQIHVLDPFTASGIDPHRQTRNDKRLDHSQFSAGLPHFDRVKKDGHRSLGNREYTSSIIIEVKASNKHTRSIQSCEYSPCAQLLKSLFAEQRLIAA